MTENLNVINNNQYVTDKGQLVTTRKIGKCTYIVSSSFKDSQKWDIASILARLIQNEAVAKLSA